jgi:hypothetical protein
MLVSRHTRRRDFIALIGGTTVWPLAARAQGEHRRRVAVMMNFPQSDPEAERASRALVAKLGEVGWTEGRNVDFDFRRVGDQVGAFPAIIKQITQLKPDVILSAGAGLLCWRSSEMPERSPLCSDRFSTRLVMGWCKPWQNPAATSPGS